MTSAVCECVWGRRHGPDPQEHGEMVAAQVRSDGPGTSPRQGRAADGDVRGRLAVRAIAREGRSTAVEDRPAASVEPLSHALADLVRFLAAGVP